MTQTSNHTIQKPSRRGRANISQVDRNTIQRIRNKRLNTSLDDNSHVSSKVKRLRERVWDEWEEYTRVSEIDGEQVWRQLCENVSTAAQEFCSFLEYYIATSTKLVPSLGPDEYEEERTVNSAATIQDVWSALVAVANDKVLRQLRLQFPGEQRIYILRYTTRGGQDAGPAGRVGRLIPELAISYGLSRSQLFEKSEMTLQDILMILRTVWERASYIPCQPCKRLAFTGILVMGGIGGWRFESLKQLTYRHVKVAWLKDLENPQKARCVATIRIHHAKWKRDKIERDQTSSFTFSITLVPFKPVCLLSHIVAMAFFKNAFSTDFATPEKILYPEPDFTVNYVPLAWKEEMLDEHVFPLDYKSYWALWNRVLLVGGLRSKPKPYSVRVGAGNRLDGALTTAIRSYVFGNTDAVFRKSYIPVDIAHDLMGIAYGSVAGQNQKTISYLHEAFSKRDESAPVYISEEEFKTFEARSDITEWRRQRDAMSDLSSKEAKNLLSKIHYTKNVLESKLLEKKRKDYFEKADILRSTGQSISHLHQVPLSDPRPRQNQSSSKMAEQLAPYFVKDEDSCDIASRIVGYLRQCSTVDSSSELGLDTIATVTKVIPARSTCFLCFKEYTTRAGLTAHVQRLHSNNFTQSFHCLECKHKGQDVLVPAGLPAWSSHTELCHGSKHSPRPGKESGKLAHCLLCNRNQTLGGFNLHLRKAHERDFIKSFPCPECRKAGCESMIEDKNHWILHVKCDHGGSYIPGAVLLQAPSQSVRAHSHDGEEVEDNSLPEGSKKRKSEEEGATVKKRLRTGDGINLFEVYPDLEVKLHNEDIEGLGRDPRFYDCLEDSK